MENGNQIFQEVLIKIIRATNEINSNIITKKISTILDVKRNFLLLKKLIETHIQKDQSIIYEGNPLNCLNELSKELEKLYSISLNFFRSVNWGVFAKLNPKKYPDLY
jgi:hypothetical protein